MIYTQYQKVVLWPNIDAGSDDVSKGIRVFKEGNLNEPFHFFRNFSPEDYACVLKNAICTVGNSSSFIREGAFLGVPSVIIGDRQQGRETADNIMITDYNKDEIKKAVMNQINKFHYTPSNIFGDGVSGKLIGDKIAEILNA